MIYYNFTDTEIKKLLKENLVILIDTREQVNGHVIQYFEAKKIKYKSKKLDEGDYTAMILARPEMGIYKDLRFKVAVERKNSVDELIQSIKDATRFEHEFAKAVSKGIKVHLLVEDKDGLNKIRTGQYRSQYEPKAFWGKLHSLEDKYLKGTIFDSKDNSGLNIYSILYYTIRNSLRDGDVDLTPNQNIGE